MSEKKINMIQTVDATLSIENLDQVERHADTKSLVHLVTGLLSRGFREDTLDDVNIKSTQSALKDMAEEAGERLNLDGNTPDHVRSILGMIWLGQIAQATWVSELTEDPVLAIAINEIWNQAHTEMAVAGLSADQTARYEHLMQRDPDDADPVEQVLGGVHNINTTGCPCGRDHTASGKSVMEGVTSASLLASLPASIQTDLDQIAEMTGESKESLVKTLTDVFLSGGKPGDGAAQLLAKALARAGGRDPNPEKTVGVVELPKSSSNDQLAEKLYNELVQAQGAKWSDAQKANLREQIRKNIPQILAGGPVKIEIDLT